MLQSVKIAGKEYPVSFGHNALRNFCKSENITFSELTNLSNNMRFDLMIAMAFAGLKDGARRAKAPFSLTIEDVSDMFDEDADAINRVMDIVNDSMLKSSPESASEKKEKPRP